MEDIQNAYLAELIKKFDFIQGAWITDYEGAVISSSLRSEDLKEGNNEANTSVGEEKQGEMDRNHKIKVSLSYQFNSAIDQITKIEKWKTKCLVTVFENATIFQSKINKTVLAHFICDSKNFNYEVMKEIVSEVQEKLQKVEKEIESLTQINDAN